MKTIAILAALALGLSACQSSTNIDSAIQSNLPRTCALINTAHAAFVAASISGRIPKKTVRREAAAYAGVQAICANPETATASDALVLAAQAYATISLSLKDAKKRK